MKKYKFIEEIPLTGYAFEVGDEINVRKTLDSGSFRWEQYKIAADGLAYPSSIQEEEWDKLNELTPEVLDKLIESYTNAEIDQMISEGVIGAASGLVIVKGTALPTPPADVAFAIVGQGVYTKAGQESVVVPTNHLGILLWELPTWSLGAVQEVPNNVDQKIDEQKGIPGGIAPLDGNNKVPVKHIDAYTKAEQDAKDATHTTELGKKVDKITGKGLSTNDYTSVDANKVSKLVVSGDGKYVLTDNGTYVKLSGGSGSGFYNVTSKLPLAEGDYYTLTLAVTAVAAQDIDDVDKEGMIITFESAEGVWDDYRFVGTPAVFNDPTYWQEYTIKDIIRGVIYNGVELVKDSAGKVAIDVVTDVDQTIDPGSTNAVSGAAVAAEFASLSAKYAVALQLNESGEEDAKVYSISLLDEDGNVLSTSGEFSGGGGGGGSISTTKIVLAKNTENPTVKQGDPVRLEYYYDHRDTAADSSTGLSGKATITVVSGATSTVSERTLSADSTNFLDVTEQLLVGSNTVRIRVEVDNGETIQVSTISWKVQVITLRLTSSFDYATLTTKGQNIIVPYNLTGSGTKTLRLLVNGDQVEDRVITTSSSNGSFTINTTNLSHGSHSIQLVAILEVSSSVTLSSNSIYFDVAVREIGRLQPIVATRFDYLDGTIIAKGAVPVVKTSQFGEYKVNYAGYNPSVGQDVITVTVANTVIASITSSFAQRSVSNRSTQVGLFPGTIKIGTTTYPFNVDVAKSDANIVEPTDNLIFKLSALGRTNNDENKDSWTYQGITTTFTNVQHAGDGWIDNALRLMNGGKAVINYKPLDIANAPARLNAFAYTAKFKVSNVSDTTAPLISCMSNGVGFEITSEEARMVTSGNSEVVMKFASGRAYNIAFVSMPIADPVTASEYEIANSQMLYLYIDGILSGGVQKGTGDNIYQQGLTTNITLQGVGSTLDVYNTRLYNNYLTSEQVLNIYMIDLDTVAEILQKYEFNNIIDEEGDVTVESLPDGMRYVIVTGQQANGMSTLKYAAAINNKDARYDVSDIMVIVKGSDLTYNFKCVGGCIRLQGTSSLAYPIKNYRIYFRSAASSSVFGQVYKGVDAQGNGGTLITAAKPKVSFKKPNPVTGKAPAPVNVWCLKADFAESSSSHNTGMARLTNDVFISSGSPTPAQKHVLPTHPYDVRTAIDGEPCYLFSRNTESDKPVFLGKFNFNNDKSTEEVFGFLDIPGYHVKEDGTPTDWVTTKFAGKNPTECWEFLNNDFPMGMYLDDNFDAMADGKPAWTKVFEARFPDVQGDYDNGTLGKPAVLERWVKWVKSTQANPAKFKAELSNYADVGHLTKYFVFTQIFAAVDQMVKNAMLGFWYNPDVDKMLAHYIFYDGDTILGLRNDGRLKYTWDITRMTLDPELTASAGKNIYAFMGHDSVLWNNLESQFATEIGEAYKSIRGQMTNDFIFNRFDKEQAGKFAERIYNLDAQYKYIEPATLGVSVINNGTIVNTKYSHLEAMQGSRASHRRWWLENRLDLFDARYGTGQYTLTDITWKGISDVGAKVSVVMSRDYYAEVKRESTSMKRSFAAKDSTWDYAYDQTANIGTIFHLFGGKYFRRLDLSEWGGFTDLTLPVLLNLEQLILGRTSRTYTLSELTIGGKLPMVKLVDITNYVSLPSIDLSTCVKLETFIAEGCTSLGTARFPSGSPLHTLRLPQNLSTLSLIGLPVLQNSGIIFNAGNNVRNLIVDSCPRIDWEALFTTLGGVTNIRITGINKRGNKAWLDKFFNLGGLDANGNVVETPRLVGKYQLETYLEDSVYAEYRTKFPELEIIQPEYSIYTMHLNVSNPANILNKDNGTGYDPDLLVQTKPYVTSGHVKSVFSNFHRGLGKHSEQGVMSFIQLSDTDSTKFQDGSPANIAGYNGDVWVKRPKFWYKGVNDILNGKIHIVVSSNNTKPTIAEHKKLTVTDVIEAQTSFRLDTSQTSLAAAKVGDPKYNIGKVDISDPKFSKIRIPMAPYGTTAAFPNWGNIGGLFLDANNNIVNVAKVSTNICADGMYIVMDKPANAKYYYHTYSKSITFGTIILYNGPIENAEPDWVEVKETLIAAFVGSIDVNNKIRSVSIPDGSSGANKLNVNQTYLDMCNARLFDNMGYEDAKTMSWLHILKYGTTRLDTTIGIGVDSSYWSTEYRPIGVTSTKGMLDTTRGGYWVKNEAGQDILVVNPGKHTNFLGVECLWGQDTWLATQVSRNWNSQTAITNINTNGKDDTPQRALAYSPSNTGYDQGDNYYYKRTTDFQLLIYGEKYLDLLPVGLTLNTPSITTYLSSFVNMSSTALTTSGGTWNININGSNPDGNTSLLSWSQGYSAWANAGGSLQPRLKWSRSIKIVTDKQVFNNITEIA